MLWLNREAGNSEVFEAAGDSAEGAERHSHEHHRGAYVRNVFSTRIASTGASQRIGGQQMLDLLQFVKDANGRVMVSGES